MMCFNSINLFVAKLSDFSVPVGAQPVFVNNPETVPHGDLQGYPWFLTMLNIFEARALHNDVNLKIPR